MRDSRVLELDSQGDLLERLSLLTRFGSNLVVVGGAQGAGKTWLAQCFLEVWAQEKNQALLLCHPNQTEDQRRASLIEQWFPKQGFYTNTQLADNLEQILEGEPCDLILVIDDAHLLSEQLLSELWLLSVAANQRSDWAINIVLMAHNNSVNPLLKRLSYGQDLKPIELDIDQLAEPEAERFFEFLVMRYVEPDMEKQVRQSFAKVTRYPGEIMALADQKKEKTVIVRSIVGSPRTLILIVLLLLLLIAGGYWWLSQQSSPDDNRARIESMVEQTVIPTLPESSATGSRVERADPSFAEAEDDSASLPQAVTDSTATVGIDDSERRVVITSDVVDALLDESATSETIPELKELEETVIQEVAPEETTIATPELAPIEPEVVEQPPQTQINFSFAREELLAYSPRSYTLQLAALNTLEEVQLFIDEHPVDGEVRIYPTLRDDVKWFIVTFENYPTIQAARDAVVTLPNEVQQLSPWAKAMAQVHREIETAN
ncbi:AAA family ATPase [Vibrio agarivorans]|uniref:AAA family ATPase n=1 Tax=Vibrio agarivorans TaxID=153622 RepID=UPI00222EE945|nr:AAA family ATPase [Vibrio agarivorans]